MRGLADVRLRPAECRQAAPRLPALAAEEVGVDERIAVHVAQCLRCQAEVVVYRRILRHLRSLRQDEMSSPPGAIAEVLDALARARADLEGPSASTNRVLRVAYVGGLTVATAAAGAAGVLVWMNRRRPGLARTG